MTSGAVSRSAQSSRAQAGNAVRDGTRGRMSFGDDLERERERVVRLVRHASVGWAEAMRAHKLAPPDAGFADSAAEAVGGGRRRAARLAAGSRRRTCSGVRCRARRSAEPPYELRPGTGRRGPEDLWLHFDSAVMEMNRAIGGSERTRGRQCVRRRLRGGSRTRARDRRGGRDHARGQGARPRAPRGLSLASPSLEAQLVQRNSASVVTTAS